MKLSTSYRHTYVGDLPPDNDDKNFQVCHDGFIIEYFNNGMGLEYKREKHAIDSQFKRNFIPQNLPGESGLIRIRFVVNCKGKAGRFSLLCMDENYNTRIFNSFITDQLLEITRNLHGWKAKTFNKMNVDYYQYLIFRMQNGNISEIMP